MLNGYRGVCGLSQLCNPFSFIIQLTPSLNRPQSAAYPLYKLIFSFAVVSVGYK